MIPDFVNKLLPPGVHNCSCEEFISRFATGGHRGIFGGPAEDIFDYAVHHGAISVLFGGSFISDAEAPNDIDCVIVFENSSQIPSRIESLTAGTVSIDVYFASMDQPQLVASYRKLFGTNRSYSEVGVVEVSIRDAQGVHWDIVGDPEDQTYEIVRRAYLHRHIVERIKHNKIIVTVHGIRTHGDWNAEIVMHGSANGWTVAPFQYGYVEANIFLDEKARRDVVDKFRDFLADVSGRYGENNFSVIAHSFGTYILWKYLAGFGGASPIRFNTAILAGTVLNSDLDLTLLEGNVSHLINEIAPNDEWAEKASWASFKKDKEFGDACLKGFSSTSPILQQQTSDIFKHNNVIRRDVVVHRWFPWLEAYSKNS